MSKLYRTRTSDRGFTLPVTMGLGLIMMLTAAALIGSAQSDQALAALQAKSAGSLNAAETGLARVQSYLNQNRYLATRNLSEWSQLLTPLGLCPNAAGNDNAVAIGQQYVQGQWQQSTATHQFRLVNYAYHSQPGAQRQMGLAELTVEGQLTGGSNATSRLVVEIPVSLVEGQTPPPALWVNTVNLNSAAKITGDVRITGCAGSVVPGIGNVNIALGGDEQPTGTLLTASYPLLPQSVAAPGNALSLPPIKSDIVLPRPGDTPDSQGNFHYVVNADLMDDSIKLADDQKITVQVAANQAVNLYTSGQIDLGGGRTIVTVAGDPQPHPEKLRIYGSNHTHKFAIKDSASIMALIHAPLATGIAESSLQKGTGITGGLWLQRWDTATHNSPLPIRQMGSWPDWGIRPEEQVGVKLQPVSSWQRQEQP